MNGISDKRLKEIEEKLRERLNITLKNVSYDDMSCHRSKVSFHASLAPIGYPFRRLPYMDDDFLKPIVTKEEFDDPAYDEIYTRLFEETDALHYGKQKQ